MDFKELSLAEILVDHDFNCRGEFSEESIKELAGSIAKDGLLQPVVVFEIPTPVNGMRYKLTAGFRRYMAHMYSKAETIKAHIVPFMDDTRARIMNLQENVQRKNLTMYREALAVKPLFDKGWNEPRIMQELSVSRGWIQQRHYILLLPEDIQAEFCLTEIWGGKEIREAYTTLRRDGESGLRRMVKIWKDRKSNGLSASMKQNNTMSDIIKKRARGKTEIEAMQDMISNQLGPCFATRLLAWCGGYISDFDLFQDIKKECTKEGVDFVAPEVKL